MGTINREWHLGHLMPKNPTAEQRLEWHLAHAEHCTCRILTPEMRAELEARAEAARARREKREKRS